MTTCQRVLWGEFAQTFGMNNTPIAKRFLVALACSMILVISIPYLLFEKIWELTNCSDKTTNG